jgi:hypothetical protein
VIEDLTAFRSVRRSDWFWIIEHEVTGMSMQ